MTATPQSAILFLGSLATLATIGMFRDLGDEPTRLVVAFAAAILWGLFGMSSFDVLKRPEIADATGEPLYPLVYLGIGFSVVVSLFAIRLLFKLLQGEVEDSNIEDTLQ